LWSAHVLEPISERSKKKISNYADSLNDRKGRSKKGSAPAAAGDFKNEEGSTMSKDDPTCRETEKLFVELTSIGG